MPDLDIDHISPTVVDVCRTFTDAGGRAWLVGGSVRDLLLGQISKDPDIEVYGLQPDDLHRTLSKLGKVEFVGQQFGVFKLWKDDLCIDIALPRIEQKTGLGHKAFAVTSDPDINPEKASLRRDFTINAMMLDPLNAEFLDFHGGRSDLKAGILRHVSQAFAEDPLRVLRGMQFAARYRLKLDKATKALCQRLLPEAETLSKERIWCEWQKWAHAPHPSFGLNVLNESGWLQLYPQLAALKGCVQDPRWHPEGDVWIHTKLVVDQAVKIAERCYPEDETRECLIFAALCHDLGKPATTFTHETRRIRSTGHSEAGEEPARAFLAAIGAPKRISQYVIPLIREHLVHLHGQPTSRAVRRLAHRLEPASIELWESLVEADASGRTPLPPTRPALSWLEKARQVAVQNNKPEPLATGRMLLELGMKQGPEMGRLLTQAYEAQLDGEINDASGARDWLSRKLGNG